MLSELWLGNWLWLDGLRWLWLDGLLCLDWLMLLYLARAHDCPPVVDEQEEVLVPKRVEAHEVNCFKKWQGSKC